MKASVATLAVSYKVEHVSITKIAYHNWPQDNKIEDRSNALLACICLLLFLAN